MQGTGRDELGSRPQEEVRTPEAGITRTMNLDGVAATPESNKTAKGKRRSLQKTLREASSVSQRHRRNKESESTVRSGGGDGDNADPEATPGLERAQGRFILHGKQASVVHFGNDWPTERMRLRREKWHREHSRPNSPGNEDEGLPSMIAMGSPVVQDLDDGEGSTTASHDYSGAESFADASETSKEVHRETGEGGSADGFDPYESSWEPRSEKRITVIGPKPGANIPRSPVDGGGKLDEDEEGESDYEDAKEHRRTVIGPPFVFPSVESTSEAAGQDGQESSNAADQEQSEEGAQKAS
jgi:hypothetical protein